jgi:hypothetical protein
MKNGHSSSPIFCQVFSKFILNNFQQGNFVVECFSKSKNFDRLKVRSTREVDKLRTAYLHFLSFLESLKIFYQGYTL